MRASRFLVLHVALGELGRGEVVRGREDRLGPEFPDPGLVQHILLLPGPLRLPLLDRRLHQPAAGDEVGVVDQLHRIHQPAVVVGGEVGEVPPVGDDRLEDLHGLPDPFGELRVDGAALRI